MTDYDSPWKEALALFFREFLAFFFPAIHAAIDWNAGYESLDKELQQVIREADSGRFYVDHLVRVRLQDGREEWLLIHVEVQTQADLELMRRLYHYNNRLRDRYQRDVVTLAVLADDRENWRPDHYEFSLWGFRTRMEFPTVKLLDIVRDRPNLETDANPFAVLTLAHVRTLETKGNPDERRVWKFRLVRSLYERGLSAGAVRELLRCVDWMMDLPKESDALFWQDVAKFEKEKKMPFIDYPTRKGMEQGLVEAILLEWELKFGFEGGPCKQELLDLDDLDLLRKILRASKTAASVDEVRKLWKPVP